ncbi:odorant receptor 13a-like isoform X2 [Athalia rosae]|uniref:odorant receptor 13a-like isoform X2 n=1 Tax=Athalia rosae TaxID=37344 RepID=UPI0020341FD8|nr:odorant receptor 13a-like isoform X2 [Athalia rosae]
MDCLFDLHLTRRQFGVIMSSVGSEGKTVNVVRRIRVPYIIMRMVGYNLLDYDSNNKMSKTDFCLRSLAIGATLYMIIPGLVAMTEFDDDLGYLSKTASIMMTVTQNLGMLCNFYYRGSKYRSLIKKMREELWTETLSPSFWGHFKRFDRYATVITACMMQGFYGASVMFWLLPLLVNDFDLYKDVNAPYRTPFVGKYFYDHRVSRIRRWFLSSDDILCAATVGVALVSFYGTASMHLCAKLRLLNLRFTGIDATTSEREFIGITREHEFLIRFAKDVEDIHNPILLIHFLLSTLIICLNIVMLTLASEKQDTLDLVLSMLYFGAAVVEIFILCWVANQVFVQSENLARAIYSCRWYEASVFVRHGVLLILARTQRPSVLTAGKFFPVTLESFTTVCSTAASYYTVLIAIA